MRNREIIMINDTCRASSVAGETTITTITQKRIIPRRQVVEFNELKACEISRPRLTKNANLLQRNCPKRKSQQQQVLSKFVLGKSISSEPFRKRHRILLFPVNVCLFSSVLYISLLFLPSFVPLICLSGK